MPFEIPPYVPDPSITPHRAAPSSGGPAPQATASGALARLRPRELVGAHERMLGTEPRASDPPPATGQSVFATRLSEMTTAIGRTADEVVATLDETVAGLAEWGRGFVNSVTHDRVEATVDLSGISERQVNVGEVNLHVLEAGPADGPVVILLHGFPEFSYAWRHQIPALAEAGYRVVAPDMRGYNLSDKPAGVAAYGLDRLAQDVQGLVHAYGVQKAHVVGHDWGAIVAYQFAMNHPDALDHLVILNGAHPDKYVNEPSSKPWRFSPLYWRLFAEKPELAAFLGTALDHAWIRSVMKYEPVRPHAFSPEEIESYIAALDQPRALESALHYYAAVDQAPPAETRRVIEAPVLVAYGEHDNYVRPDIVTPDPALVPHARLVTLPDASHWVQNDRPEAIRDLLLGFLPRPRPAQSES